MNFTGSGQVYTSLGAASVLSNALETGFLPVSEIQSYAYRYNNHGFAFDFGVNLQLLDRINVSASVIDLGGITWKENLKSYTEEGFEYKINYFQEFDTTDFGDIIEVDEALENLEPLDIMIGVTDSLVKVISTDIKNESFRTSIPTKINLATSFALTDRIDIGILSHSVFI